MELRQLSDEYLPGERNLAKFSLFSLESILTWQQLNGFLLIQLCASSMKRFIPQSSSSLSTVETWGIYPFEID